LAINRQIELLTTSEKGAGTQEEGEEQKDDFHRDQSRGGSKNQDAIYLPHPIETPDSIRIALDALCKKV
jgi:hypothetical protein